METAFVTALHLRCWQRSRRQKRSSGKSISEAALFFQKLTCVQNLHSLQQSFYFFRRSHSILGRSLPILRCSCSIKLRSEKHSERWCHFLGCVPYTEIVGKFSTGNFNSHFDLYSNECITRLQSLSHLNSQSSFPFPYELCCTTTIELSIPATFFQHSINKYAKMKYFWKPGELWYVLLVPNLQFTCTLYNYDGYKTNK